MKKIGNLAIDIDKFGKNLISNLIKAEEETAESIKNDAIANAPVDTGTYRSSITTDKPVYKDNKITTIIGSNLKTEDGYFLGRMLENGTGIYALEPHIGKTKTFINSGYRYWYLPVEKAKKALGRKITLYGKEYYVMHAQPAKPHFTPAYNMNVRTRHENISKALKESKI